MVTAVTEIGGDVLEVITTELWRDRLRDLHDLPELVVGQGDGSHSGDSFSASSSRTWRQTIDSWLFPPRFRSGALDFDARGRFGESALISHKPSRPLSKSVFGP
jgi:hypothetical protein